MKKIYNCYMCKKTQLSRNTIGINKKLLGDNVKRFLCLECLANYLEVTVSDILAKIEEFKESGCKLFE